MIDPTFLQRQLSNIRKIHAIELDGLIDTDGIVF